MLVIVKPLKVQYLITVGWKRYAQTNVLNIPTTYRTSFSHNYTTGISTIKLIKG